MIREEYVIRLVKALERIANVSERMNPPVGGGIGGGRNNKEPDTDTGTPSSSTIPAEGGPPEDDCTVIRKNLRILVGNRALPRSIYAMIMAAGESYEFYNIIQCINEIPGERIKWIWRLYKNAYGGDGR